MELLKKGGFYPRNWMSNDLVAVDVILRNRQPEATRRPDELPRPIGRTPGVQWDAGND